MPRTQRAIVWILPDQLTPDHPALVQACDVVGKVNVRVVLVESQAWMTRLPFHRKRQVLILSAGRHFARELEERGFTVDIVPARDSRAGVVQSIRKHKPRLLLTMEASEYAPRHWQRTDMAPDLGGLAVEVLPNTMFLVGRHDPCPDARPAARIVMENFYRSMRSHFQLLIEPDGTPSGGAWNFDKENRKPLPKRWDAPGRGGFPPDAITLRTIEEVDSRDFGVGTTGGFDLAVTRADAETAFDDFLTRRLAKFGPYEDAMSRRDGVLWHSQLSPYMNLGLLEPLAMARAAEAAYREGLVPINSAEGFIRQIIGWREFIYWQYHRQMPGLQAANAWDAHESLPSFFWDAGTDMACLKTLVERLLSDGFTHHIERLMVICNFCMLAGVDPAAVADWFLTFYIDSQDWVVLPNVIGMGLNADGGVTATKPYIASSNYIHRMSDFCESCRYDPRQRTGPDACPFNTLYWNFLIEQEERLRSNPRLGPAVLGLKHLDTSERRIVQNDARQFLRSLQGNTNDTPQRSSF